MGATLIHTSGGLMPGSFDPLPLRIVRGSLFMPLTHRYARPETRPQCGASSSAALSGALSGAHPDVLSGAVSGAHPGVLGTRIAVSGLSGKEVSHASTASVVGYACMMHVIENLGGKVDSVHGQEHSRHQC